MGGSRYREMQAAASREWRMWEAEDFLRVRYARKLYTFFTLLTILMIAETGFERSSRGRIWRLVRIIPIWTKLRGNPVTYMYYITNSQYFHLSFYHQETAYQLG